MRIFFCLLLIFTSRIGLGCTPSPTPSPSPSPSPTPSCTAIPTPTGVDATDGEFFDRVVITWDKIDEATSYTVYYGIDEIIFDTFLTVTMDEIATHVVGYDDTHYFYEVAGISDCDETSSTLYSEGYASTFSLCFNTVAWWRMDDNAANTTVKDSVGGFDGTFSDATGDPNTDAHTTAGASVLTHMGLEFDGVDDSISFGNTVMNDVLTTGSDWALSFWWKHPDIAPVGADRVISKFSTVGFEMQVLTNEVALFIQADGGAILLAQFAGTYADGQWHHYVLLRNVTTLEIWRDNVIEETDTNANNVGQIGNSSFFRVGQRDTGGLHARGVMDDMRVFNRALTTNEIEALYNEGKGSGLCEPQMIGPYPPGYFSSGGSIL